MEGWIDISYYSFKMIDSIFYQFISFNTPEFTIYKWSSIVLSTDLNIFHRKVQSAMQGVGEMAQ